MSESEHFDLVVIGSGPAGEKGAAQAAYFGKRVCLIERAPKPGSANGEPSFTEIGACQYASMNGSAQPRRRAIEVHSRSSWTPRPTPVALPGSRRSIVATLPTAMRTSAPSFQVGLVGSFIWFIGATPSPR